jgi:hypothetical protein
MGTRWALSLIAMFVLSGCGGGSEGPKTVPVSGTVTYKNEPVADLAVTFTPDGKGMVATGKTDAQGKFSLSTSAANDGAMPGSYTVTIIHAADEAPPMPGWPGSEKKPKSPIPTKYASLTKSGLKQTVADDPEKNNFTFDLKD